MGLFVKPLFEAMAEQNKTVQAGTAMCLAKVVECAGGGGREAGRPASAAGSAFQKLCPRICKLLGGQSFLAKGALLSVISSLSQVGAISSQGMQPVLQTIRECLDSSDWATRKAAADTLVVLVSHSSNLITDGGAASVITALEACRFDKVKPVRDSMMEALTLWKKISGKGEDGTLEGLKDGKKRELTENEEKSDQQSSNASTRRPEAVKDSSSISSPIGSDTLAKGKGSNILEKAAVILKKKAPSLTDKELNPEFFQKLETRSSDDLPVEVVLPRRCLQSSHSQREEPESTGGDPRSPSNNNGGACHQSNDDHVYANNNYQRTDKRHGTFRELQDSEDNTREKWTEQRGVRNKDLKARSLDSEDRVDISQKVLPADRVHLARPDGNADASYINNKGHWLAIHKQLSQLERQQTNLMNMLQGFMGGSHDSMVTLENRVRGLERVVEEMARDLSLSTGKRGGNMMMGYDGSPGRSSTKYNGLNEFPVAKFGRGNDSRIPFAERYLLSDSMVSGARGRDPSWRSDSESWDSYAYSAPRNGLGNSRRFGAASIDGRIQRTDHDGDLPGSRRAWDKGQGPFRLGEGPSARSVWQASKDEATLEAIRVAGEDNGTSLSAERGAIRELDAEALVDDNRGNDKGQVWASWTRAMDSLHAGDMDSAYAEVLSTGDDLLLVKLMDRSGPVMDQLSTEIACEVLRAVAQFLLEQSLLDVALPWTQQLIDLVEENGADFLGIPLDGKREILMNLRDASLMESPEDWEGAPIEELMMQLAFVWGINIQPFIK